jgi:HTH-type transcriptional regulator/antitoxin HigA
MLTRRGKFPAVLFFANVPWALTNWLVRGLAMEIHPIKNDDDHSAALREIEKLWGAAPGTDDGDRLDILVTLVAKYEEGRWPDVDTSDPVDLLNYAIDELGHSQAELAELLGSRSRASEVLNRRRALTVEMIHRISEAWKIPADLLVRPSRVAA